ncbi:MAG: hypothetical protein AB4057_00290 [Crocosphaera sp.]
MAMYRKLLIPIVLSIFIVITVWLGVQPDSPNIMIDNYIMKPINSELDIELTKPFEQNNYQTTLSTPVIQIEGKTTIPSKVELSLNNIFIKKTETDSQGKFRFEGISLRPGYNDIDVTANTQIGWRKLEGYTRKSINLEFETPSTPMIFPLPSKINSPSLIINGKADPEMDILVVVENNDRSQKYQENTNTDRKGQYELPTIVATL